MISAHMVGKFARAPLPTIGAAAGEFAHPTAQIPDSLCQTANAALIPGVAFFDPLAHRAAPLVFSLQRGSGAPERRSVRVRAAPWRGCEPRLKDACEASPCPLRSGHSPCGAPLRPLRHHPGRNARWSPECGLRDRPAGAAPASALWLSPDAAPDRGRPTAD